MGLYWGSLGRFELCFTAGRFELCFIAGRFELRLLRCRCFAFSRLIFEHDCKEKDFFLQKHSSSVSPSTRGPTSGAVVGQWQEFQPREGAGGWLTPGGALACWCGWWVSSRVPHSFPHLHPCQSLCKGKREVLSLLSFLAMGRMI